MAAAVSASPATQPAPPSNITALRKPPAEHGKQGRLFEDIVAELLDEIDDLGQKMRVLREKRELAIEAILGHLRTQNYQDYVIDRDGLKRALTRVERLRVKKTKKRVNRRTFK